MPPSAVTRFAPSPTGLLHLGHVYSALFAAAAAGDGRFLLRIEDIDPGRCRADFEAAILEDLDWLGLTWDTPVRRQSEHLADYAAALDRLDAMGMLYPCFCTRKEIKAEIAAAGRAPHGPDGPLYPGTCRRLDAAERRDRLAAGADHALRLDVNRATRKTGRLNWHDRARGRQEATPHLFGDVVLARKEVRASYHLAATLDDHLQEVTLVTRGADLFEASHLHRLLQALLGLNTPDYHHHRLVTGPDGKRLAKRDGATTLRAMRNAGNGPSAIRRLLRTH